MIQISLYNTKITPPKNLWVQEIETYIGGLIPIYTINNAQKIRTTLDQDIKLNIPQSALLGDTPNYLQYIENGVNYYYYILEINQINSSTLSFKISLDTINTFSKDIKFTNKTNIVREHVPRFYEPNKDIATQRMDFTESKNIQNLSVLINNTNIILNTSGTTPTPPLQQEIITTVNCFTGDYEFNFTNLGDLAKVYVSINGQFYYNNFKIKITEQTPVNIYIDTASYFFGGENLDISVKVLYANSYSLLRKIDKNKEGIDCKMYLDSSNKLSELNSYLNITNWYLIYRTRNNLSSNDLNNPIEVSLLADKKIPVEFPVTILTLDLRDVFTLVESGVEYVYFNKLGDKIRVYFDNISGDITFGSTEVFDGATYFGEQAINTGVIHKFQYTHLVGSKKFTATIYDQNDVELWSKTLTNNTDLFNYTDRIELFNTEYYYYKTSVDGNINIEKVLAFSSDVPKLGFIPSLQSQPSILNNSRTMKIVALPYAPVKLKYNSIDEVYYFDTIFTPSPYGFFKADGVPDLLNENCLDFNYNDIYVNIPFNKDIVRNDLYESKLLSSEYFLNKLCYDDFENTLELENISSANDHNILNTSINNTYNVELKVTSTLNSQFIFKVKPPLLINDTSQFNKLLNVKRNNEIPIYSNQYIDYIRNGYRYDIKSKTLQEKQQWLSTGLNIAGSVLSAGASVFTGNPISGATAITLGVSAINSISTNITRKTENDNNIANKLNTLKNQASTVSTNDSFDLLEYYSGNKCFNNIYKPRADVISAVADLFYYCGYARMLQGIPNINSRKYFNYLQGDVDIEPVGVRNNYLADITMRFKTGVTILHNVNGYYDFEQVKENWEVFI